MSRLLLCSFSLILFALGGVSDCTGWDEKASHCVYFDIFIQLILADSRKSFTGTLCSELAVKRSLKVPFTLIRLQNISAFWTTLYFVEHHTLYMSNYYYLLDHPVCLKRCAQEMSYICSCSSDGLTLIC